MTSLTQALPLTRGIDNQIQFLLVDYMTNVHLWTKQIFRDAQYSYIKDDLASVQRPSVFVYPMHSKKQSFGFYQDGVICMELRFSLKNQRVNIAQNVIQIANIIQLMNLAQVFTLYLQQFMPGLFWFGKECKADYTKVYDKECVVKLEFDYRVDFQAYQNELQDIGCDITSPDSVIYPPVQTILEGIAVLNSDQHTEFVI